MLRVSLEVPITVTDELLGPLEVSAYQLGSETFQWPVRKYGISYKVVGSNPIFVKVYLYDHLAFVLYKSVSCIPY